MKLLVLGGSGFLGSWVIRAAVAAGHSTSTLVRSPAPWRLAGLAETTIVSRAPEDWPEEIRRRRPDILVMLDWSGVSADARDAEAQFDNVERQRHLIAAALDVGVHKIVGAGSQAELGPTYSLVAEDAPARPISAYGRAKLSAQTELARMCEGTATDWAWARVFSVFGPLDNDGLLLSTIADGLARGDDVALSSGEQQWSYLYAADAGRAFEIIGSTATGTGLINVGHPDAPALRTHVEAFRRSLPSSAGAVRFAERSNDPAGVPGLAPNVEVLRSLGWEPRVSLTDGLDRSARWLRGEAVDDSLGSGNRLPARPKALN